MKVFFERIVSPAYKAWLVKPILNLGGYKYSREDLDAMGVGLHTVTAARLNRVLTGVNRNLGHINKFGMKAFLDLDGVGERSALVMSHIIAASGADVFKWIGAKGRTMKGAMANAKAKPRKRIPGRRGRRTKTT